MKGESLAVYLLPSAKKGDAGKITECFNNGLAAAEHYIRTGGLLLVSPAEEDIASSVMYGQENMDQLIETLQYAKELMAEKLDPDELEYYIKTVSGWLIRNKSRINVIIKVNRKRYVGSRA